MSYSPSRAIRHQTLTEEGKREFGYIFPSGTVPCRDNGVPSGAQLAGLDETQEIFYVDWRSLDADQQSQILDCMQAKFDAPRSVIEEQLVADGHFPIRSQFVVFAMDMRFF